MATAKTVTTIMMIMMGMNPVSSIFFPIFTTALSADRLASIYWPLENSELDCERRILESVISSPEAAAFFIWLFVFIIVVRTLE